MWLVAIVGSCLIVAIAAIGMVLPEFLLEMARRVSEPMGLAVLAAVRILLGVALLLEASASRAPLALRGIGVLVVAAGAAALFLETGGTHRLLAWWSSQPDVALRVWMLIPLSLGAFLVWALLPRPGHAPR
jgi:hypothetical protein